MKDNNIIKKKSFAFAIRIVQMYKYLKDEKKEFVLSKQLLRSGTSIGALIREAEHAQSKQTLYIKCRLLLKKPMKQIIGLNYYIGLNTLRLNPMIL